LRKPLGFGFADIVLGGIGIAYIAAAIFGFATSHSFRSAAIETFIAGLGALSLGSLFLRPPVKALVAINVLTAFLVIVICEIGFAMVELRTARMDHALSPYVLAAKAAGERYDPRSRLDVIAQLRSGGTDAVAPINLLTEPALTSDPKRHLWPLSGISHKLTVFCNETGVYSTYVSDRYGFNNPDAVFDRPLDIAVLGDSFAQGACVPTEQSITGSLRAANLATASFGWLGDGPLAGLAALQEYVAAFKPKIVLWFFVRVDLKTLEDEKGHEELTRYLSDAQPQHLIDRQPEADRLLKAYFEQSLAAALTDAAQKVAPTIEWMPLLKKETASSLRLEHLRQRITGAFAKAYSTSATHKTPSVPPIQRDFATFSQILTQADLDVRAWGGTLYFVFLPDWELLQNRNDPDFVNRYGIPNGDHEKVLAIARDAGLRVIDLYPAMASAQDVSHFFPFGLFAHYTAETDRMVGNSILAQLGR
jgi:hypothetical protein